ncbi:MAG: hypothetical protein RIB45_02135 [Marivibrio sp.]|uniref:hypothetical protein n=1 Tax=Marivibrio sp. TaxID=2039719 RepID=UPI0032EDC4D9
MPSLFRRPARRSLAAAVAGLALTLSLGLGPAGAQDQSRAGPERLVTVVTAGDAQTQLMAMVLTLQAVNQGAQAQMLLCGPGGDIALKEAPESATAAQAPRGASPQGLLTRLIQGGATVEVCAIYLPNKPADASALIDGVGVAKPGPMAEALMAPRTRVLSF